VTAFPRPTWADVDAMRVEVEDGRFVDYTRRGGAWRQQTSVMTADESVTPERFWLTAGPGGPPYCPLVDDDTAAWLDKTMGEIR
jgi:hypothetical protein